MGETYARSVADAHCCLPFAKLYLSKLATTGWDVLHERVLPFYRQRGVEAQHLLTDNLSQCGWRSLPHPYDLSLAIKVENLSSFRA